MLEEREGESIIDIEICSIGKRVYFIRNYRVLGIFIFVFKISEWNWI